MQEITMTSSEILTMLNEALDNVDANLWLEIKKSGDLEHTRQLISTALALTAMRKEFYGAIQNQVYRDAA